MVPFDKELAMKEANLLVTQNAELRRKISQAKEQITRLSDINYRMQFALDNDYSSD